MLCASKIRIFLLAIIGGLVIFTLEYVLLDSSKNPIVVKMEKLSASPEKHPIPDQPVNSEKLVVPVRPLILENRVVPVRAVNPENLVVPVRPVNPENLEVPVRPVNPSNIMVADRPGKGSTVRQGWNPNNMQQIHSAYQKLVDAGILQSPQFDVSPDAPGSLLSFLLRTYHNDQLHVQDGIVPASEEGNPVPFQQNAPRHLSQPEILNGLETKVLRWNGTGWTQVHKFCAGNFGYKRTMLKSPVGSAVIYIHELQDDRFVSGSLQKYGLWDLADITIMIDNLGSDPDLGFIDIGSHVGTFSIVAALMGRQVVAVDPLVANVLRFCKSVQDNNFTDKITIFYTAISNGYKKVTFKRDLGNIGGTRIVDIHLDVNITNVYDPNYINTVPLDDLVPYIPFKRAFVKMDVEEHEYQVITSGVRFFKNLDIRGILMEWMWQKNGVNGKQLRDYLLGLGYLPFIPNGTMQLHPDTYRIWPNDILWKKI